MLNLIDTKIKLLLLLLLLSLIFYVSDCFKKHFSKMKKNCTSKHIKMRLAVGNWGRGGGARNEFSANIFLYQSSGKFIFFCFPVHSFHNFSVCNFFFVWFDRAYYFIHSPTSPPPPPPLKRSSGRSVRTIKHKNKKNPTINNNFRLLYPDFIPTSPHATGTTLETHGKGNTLSLPDWLVLQMNDIYM